MRFIARHATETHPPLRRTPPVPQRVRAPEQNRGKSDRVVLQRDTACHPEQQASRDRCAQLPYRRTIWRQRREMFHIPPQTSIMASVTPRLPLDHTRALQHRRQSTCEDSGVMLRGHQWPRRSARLMISALGSPRRTALLWYMLQASSTSAEPPILYGRSRPMAGALPKDT